MPVFVILQPAKVATPLALVITVVDVQEKPTDGLPVSTTESPDRGLPKASTTDTDGCTAKLTPATVVADGCVENDAVAAGAADTVTSELVTDRALVVPTRL